MFLGSFIFLFFFFFQAEDGIRDVAVTGVQTCALPISLGVRNVQFHEMDAERLTFADLTFDRVVCRFGLMLMPAAERALAEMHRVLVRSEEHTSELQSRLHLVCRLLLEKKKKNVQ